MTPHMDKGKFCPYFFAFISRIWLLAVESFTQSLLQEENRSDRR